jgi:hypothetical protein
MTCTNSRLIQYVDVLGRRLLPGGHWVSHWWRAGSTAGEPGQSLGLDCGRGPKRGEWRDFAAGDEHGDLLDLIAVAAVTGCNGDKAKAMRWAHDFLHAPPPPSTQPPGARPRERTSEDTAGYLRDIWREARPLAQGDLVWRYLGGRGVDLACLPALPMLRAHPGLWHSAARRRFPAMLAAMAGADGARIPALHRTWLAVKGGVVGKAPVELPKMTLGHYHAGCIPLARGATGRPWRDPAPGELVAIGEGIEDSLSIAVARPAWRVACGVSLSNMLGMALPAAIGEVVIVAQNDEAGSKAALLLPRVARHFQRLGKTVQILRPRDPAVKDVNDLTQRLRRHLAVGAG